MTKASPVLAAVLGSLLAACASEPERQPAPPAGSPAPAPRVRPFISPAGQPFRVKPGQDAPIDAWWRQVDKNGDGVVTLEEFRQDFSNFFKVVDRNGDGTIDGFELSIYENELAPELIPEIGPRDSLGEPIRQAGERRPRGGGGGRRGGGGRGGPGFGAGVQGPAAFSLTQDPEPILAADYDLSRRVTAAEFQRRAGELFAELDTDHDGQLTRAELPKPPEPTERRGRRRGRG